MSSTKSRIDALAAKIELEIQTVELNNGKLLKYESKEEFSVLAEVLVAHRENREPQHSLIDAGILDVKEGQCSMIDLIKILSEEC